jgi:hypothetical protein
MMFKRPLLDKILGGQKTQTRRSIKRKPGAQVFSVGDIVGIRAGYTKYVGYIRVTTRRREKLGCITEEDAKKEGCASVEDFKATWGRLFGRWTPGLVVWVYDFVLVQSSGSPSRDSSVAPGASLSKFLCQEKLSYHVLSSTIRFSRFLIFTILMIEN